MAKENYSIKIITKKEATEILLNYHYLKDKKPYINYIGFAKGEENRMKRYVKDNTKRFPLIEWGMTEKDCLDYCKVRGFDFENLYQYMNSTSCWCCPLQPLTALRNLYKNFPDMWKELLKMQSKTKTPFKIDHKKDKNGNNMSWNLRYGFRYAF